MRPSKDARLPLSLPVRFRSSAHHTDTDKLPMPPAIYALIHIKFYAPSNSLPLAASAKHLIMRPFFYGSTCLSHRGGQIKKYNML